MRHFASAKVGATTGHAKVMTMALRSPVILSLSIFLYACGGAGSPTSTMSGSTSSSSAPPSSGTTASTPPGNPAVNLPALHAAFAKLPHTDAASDANAMLTAALALADVKYAALSDATTVAITYKDGTEQVVALLPLNDPGNLAPASSGTSSANMLKEQIADVSLPSAGPDGRVAYLSNSLVGQSFNRLVTDPTQTPTSNWPVGPLSDWFTNASYSVTDDLAAAADLTKVQDVSVFFLHAHGGYFVDENGNYTFALATPYTTDLSVLLPFTLQLQNNSMGYFTYVSYTVDDNSVKIYSINDLLYMTPAFVAQKMSFTQNSLVYIDACSLMAGVNTVNVFSSTDAKALASQKMVQAFFNAGAGFVASWDNTVNAVQAADSALYFFDRVLGAGAQGRPGGYPDTAGVAGGYGAYLDYYAATPPNRPFNVEDVFAEMHFMSRQTNDQPSAIFQKVQNFSGSPLNLDQTEVLELSGPVNGMYTAQSAPIIANLRLMQNQNSANSTGASELMPSISAVSLNNDAQTLVVNGDFGGTYTTRSITIGGSPVSATWSGGTITVNPMPLSGAGSGGNILVTIDGLESNHVLLNQWNGVPLTLTINEGGDDTYIAFCNINLRTSFDSLRPAPDEAPSTIAISVIDTVLQNGSSCTYSGPSVPTTSIPWSPITMAFPANGTGANATGTSNPDGNGGGTMTLSFQDVYQGVILDSATNGAQILVFDDTTQNLAAGSSNLTGIMTWGAVAGLAPDVGHASALH
jgi:hypothetical protein